MQIIQRCIYVVNSNVSLCESGPAVFWQIMSEDLYKNAEVNWRTFGLSTNLSNELKRNEPGIQPYTHYWERLALLQSTPGYS